MPSASRNIGVTPDTDLSDTADMIEAAVEATKAAMKATEAEPIDGRPTAVVAPLRGRLGEIDLECQVVTLEAGGLQSHDSVFDVPPSLLKTDTVAFGGSSA